MEKECPATDMADAGKGVEPMDELLSQRLSVYEQMDSIDARIVPAVKECLLTINAATQVPLSDDSYGSLVSHLIMAVQRTLDGAPETDPLPAVVLEEVQTAAPDAFTYADKVRSIVAAAVGVNLNQVEQGFLAMHIGTILKAAATATDHGKESQ